MKNGARIRKLEGVRHKKPFTRVCNQDGVFWRVADSERNFQATMDPKYPGNTILSPLQLAELAKTHEFIVEVWDEEAVNIPGVDNIVLTWEDNL